MTPFPRAGSLPSVAQCHMRVVLAAIVAPIRLLMEGKERSRERDRERKTEREKERDREREKFY